ncbi:UDP-glucuronosyltransferase 2B14-like [Chelonus insularis]|uniref:UDP-glucuronosyltransferase 2B14-like n=1 Tax=Chelonus insularis TaxID=460826 RepID=UPI00158C9777|nr:UDP-glucuronosyltransferase 2B14-like [Chelonus insularis]
MSLNCFFFALLFILLSITISSGETGINKKQEKYKILGVFGHIGKSHFDVFKVLLEELARRGHDVTVISYFPRDNVSSPLPNYRDISLLDELDIDVNVVNLNLIKHTPWKLITELMVLREKGLLCCEKALKLPRVQEFIRSNEKFDLILTEVFNSDCFLGFVHRFKAPFISLSSHIMMPWAKSRIANLDNPSYVPHIFYGFSTNMNFIERMINTVSWPFIELFYEVGFNWPTQPLVEEAFGPGVPPLSEIAKNTSMIFVNSHYSLHGAVPTLPSVIEVGGIHVTSVQPLTEDLKRFLDNAHEGVLFFSWGSMIRASSMSNKTLTKILYVLRSIPRKVIWKWEVEELPNKPPNVLIRKWLPQAAILRHPNVKCYLAHGGMLGISEGVSAGVPMVVVPMYGDQFNNAAAAKERGVAIVLEWNNFNAKSLRSAIDRVFNDSSYQKNAKLLQKAWNDRPETPLQTAVWWTEYVARGNGNKYLKSSAASLSWYQITLIDVVIVLVMVLAMLVFIIYRIIRMLVRSLLKTDRSNVQMMKKKQN